VTASEVNLGSLYLRSMSQSKTDVKNISISEVRLLDIKFLSDDSNKLLVLTEDQKLCAFVIDELLQATKTLEMTLPEGKRFTKVRWNWINIEEILCFNDNEIYVINNSKPGKFFSVPVESGIKDIYFVPKFEYSIFLK